MIWSNYAIKEMMICLYFNYKLKKKMHEIDINEGGTSKNQSREIKKNSNWRT